MPFIPTAAAGAGLTWKHGMAAILGANMLRRAVHGRIGSSGRGGTFLGKKKTKQAGRLRHTALIQRVTRMGYHNLDRRTFYPNEKFVTLTYCKNGAVPTSAVPQTIGASEGIFRLNSTFDPDLSGAGTQPYTWDQITPQYNKYKVFAVTINLTWLSNITDEIMVGCSIILPSLDGFSLVAKTTSSIEEKRGGDVRRMAPNGEMRFEVSRRIEIKDVEGCGKEFNDDAYSAQTNNNPVRTVLLKIAAASLTSTAIVNLHFALRLDYHVKLYDRMTLAQS